MDSEGNAQHRRFGSTTYKMPKESYVILGGIADCRFENAAFFDGFFFVSVTVDTVRGGERTEGKKSRKNRKSDCLAFGADF